MKRADLAHILRAASRIAEDPDVVVFGSQAILGSFDEDELPERATLSVEADVTFWNDDDDTKSDLVDGAIGEESQFHSTFGYYAQGVSITTAVLPAGWRERLVTFEEASSAPGRGWCLEPHDLALSKLAAWREKDREFVRELIEAGLLDLDVLRDRLGTLPTGSAGSRRIERFLGSFERP